MDVRTCKVEGKSKDSRTRGAQVTRWEAGLAISPSVTTRLQSSDGDGVKAYYEEIILCHQGLMKDLELGTSSPSLGNYTVLDV